MESLAEFIKQEQVILFLLVFARLSGLFAFFPFFSHMKIPIFVNIAMTFLMTIFLFPLASPPTISMTVFSLALAVVSELMMGLIGGLMLTIVISSLQLAGMQIAFVMGFTMASVIDPQSEMSSPIISQFLSSLALMMVLAFNGHHVMLTFIAESLQVLPLGEFYPSQNIWSYLGRSVAGMFVYGFILSFPVLALSLLLDLVFGMLMKTMPQFNLLVVGFPIKIVVSFIVLCAVLMPMMLIFKKEFLEALNYLKILLIQS
ncbi:MAG: flagellar biosynthetic protein FliR [Sulfurospirillaceae bacterium]|nr:flagellar biosynthetic protein FliR [Sulfurospirillaceae bacterium]MDD3463421.1 flagellar biosynthetic protein FliR [Sulfurospirillaceae bacterium]